MHDAFGDNHTHPDAPKRISDKHLVALHREEHHHLHHHKVKHIHLPGDEEDHLEDDEEHTHSTPIITTTTTTSTPTGKTLPEDHSHDNEHSHLHHTHDDNGWLSGMGMRAFNFCLLFFFSVAIASIAGIEGDPEKPSVC